MKIIIIAILACISIDMLHAEGYTGEFNKNTDDSLYLRNRYYDPDLGVLLTRDPLGVVSGNNSYLYAKNNPTNAIDPFGLDLIYLNDENAVDLGFLGTQGHAAVLIGNPTTGYTYVSKNGTLNGGPFGAVVPASSTHYASIQEFLTTTVSTGDIIISASSRYNWGILTPSTPQQDAQALSYALQNVNAYYNFLTNNRDNLACNSAAAAGINLSRPTFISSLLSRNMGIYFWHSNSKSRLRFNR